MGKLIRNIRMVGALFHVVSTLIFVVLMGGAVMVLIPIRVVSSSYRLTVEIGLLRYFGVLPGLIGIIILFWCLWEFLLKGKGTPAPYQPPKKLVVSGLYRFTRNPMYVGVICVLLGESFLFESALLFIYAGVMFLIFHIWIIITEEPYLRSTFGESYKRYCESVPRWFFRLK